MAVNPIYLVPIGVIYAGVYYVVFRLAIIKFNFKTPGREDDDETGEKEMTAVIKGNKDFAEVASVVLEGLGGKENVASLEYCATRLRLEVKNTEYVNEKKIKSAGVAGIIRPGKTSVQIIIGTKVQFVADEMKKLL
jgi:PTS system N-acetylglucosamine-specific IIC component